MNSQQPAHSLAGFELPIEEFLNPTIDVNGSNDLQTLYVGKDRGIWRRTKSLGRGSCGHVWLQEREVDMPALHARAVKEVALSQLSKDGIDHLNEISAMARFSTLKDGNTAVFGEFYGYAMNHSTLFLAMEYFHHGDLKKHIEVRTVDEQEAKKIVYDILVGLKTIHAEGIVHRDLKPENIFVANKPPESDWSVKIADFGISKRIPPEQEWNLTLRRGTRYYTAPEVEGLIDPCRTNPGAIDMWSLGIMVYFLATKQFPFTPREVALFCRNDGKFPFPRRPMLERWSEEGVAFVEALLRPLPPDRLTAEDALRHSWFAAMGEDLEGPTSSFALSTCIISANSGDEVERDLRVGNPGTSSENGAQMSLAAPVHTQFQPHMVWVPSWAGPPPATPYTRHEMRDWVTTLPERQRESYHPIVLSPDREMITAPCTELPHGLTSPEPVSTLRTITGSISSADEIPSPTFYDFTPPGSPSQRSQARRPRGKLHRRATAPTTLWEVEDAVDLISPRTKRIEAASSCRLERFSEGGTSDLSSSTQEMSLTEPPDRPLSPPSQNTSIIWRDTRLKSFPRSMSDSFVGPWYKSDHSSQEWKRASALEFVTDPRFRDSVHALYHAIRVGRNDAVDLLLDRGVDIETVYRDPPHFQYGTALHLAISCGQADVVETLLRRGASLTAKAKAELSKFHMRWLEPLHLAAYYGLEKISRMLLDHGARIESNAIGNFTNRKKRTPLHLAVLGEDSDEIPRMVRLLVEYGADPNVKDDLGMRPGDYAVMLGRIYSRTILPASSSSKLKARAAKMRIKFGPFALAGPLILGAAGVAMVMK